MPRSAQAAGANRVRARARRARRMAPSYRRKKIGGKLALATDHRCSPPELPSQRRRRRLRSRSDGEASCTLRLRCARTAQVPAAGSQPRPEFDERVEAQFPAFGGHEMIDVARAQVRGQRLERILPERRDELVTHGEPPLLLHLKRSARKRTG